MADIYMKNFEAGINTLALIATNYAFSKSGRRKRQDFSKDKLQKAKDKWNENRMKRLDFINQKLPQKNEQQHIRSLHKL